MTKKNSFQPLFSKEFLEQNISDFDLRSIANLDDILESVKELGEELTSGKIKSLKEEEFKSRFVTTIFGNVLGYPFKNSVVWNLREEKKSTINGTKADATLGFFWKDKMKDDVRVVVEIKAAKTSLDLKENGTKRSAVDQAFEYVPISQGGNCKWVVVSNFTEIRFYTSLDRSRYQLYHLKDLLDVSTLTEMIFLFHKDQLLKEDILLKSETDSLLLKSKSFKGVSTESIHIIDKLFDSLKAFDGLGFVDPGYLASISPFNILEEHVWHYKDNTLFTLNPEIYALLKEIKIINHTIKFSKKLEKEVANSKVDDALGKLDWSFMFLNNNLIFNVSAIEDYHTFKIRSEFSLGLSIRHIFSFKNESEGISKSIRLAIKNNCECVSCLYRDLKFKELVGKLNSSKLDTRNHNLEIVYGHFLMGTDNYRSAYLSLKNIASNYKGKESKSVQYFISNLNISLLHNLIASCNYKEERERILGHIKSIDLDRIIYDDIDYNIKTPVKKYLLKIKEEEIFRSIENEVDKLLEDLEDLRQLYKRGGEQYGGPNLPNDLVQHYYKLFLHINTNFIIREDFSQHKKVVEKVFKGLLISYETPEFGISSINDFFLQEAILHINPKDLQSLLSSFSKLKTNKGGTEILLKRLTNFATSFFSNGSFFNKPVENEQLGTYLQNHLVGQKIRYIFSNMFSILSRLDIKESDFRENAINITKFLKVEEVLWSHDYIEFGFFLENKGFLFSVEELINILKISIRKEKADQIRYKELLSSIPKAIKNHYPDYKLNDISLIKATIIKYSNESGGYVKWHCVVNLCLICDEQCNGLLFAAFEQNLDKHFDAMLYRHLIRETTFTISRGDYLMKYIKYVNERYDTSKYGSLKLTDGTFMGFIYDLFQSSLEFTDQKLLSVKAENKFEEWLLNPLAFNYEKFKAIWLTDTNYPHVLNRLSSIKEIKESIEMYLRDSYHPTLAEIKYKYFL